MNPEGNPEFQREVVPDAQELHIQALTVRQIGQINTINDSGIVDAFTDHVVENPLPSEEVVLDRIRRSERPGLTRFDKVALSVAGLTMAGGLTVEFASAGGYNSAGFLSTVVGSVVIFGTLLRPRRRS